MSNLILKVFLFPGLDEVSTKIKGLSSFTDIRCRVGELMTGKRGYKQTKQGDHPHYHSLRPTIWGNREKSRKSSSRKVTRVRSLARSLAARFARHIWRACLHAIINNPYRPFPRLMAHRIGRRRKQGDTDETKNSTSTTSLRVTFKMTWNTIPDQEIQEYRPRRVEFT